MYALYSLNLTIVRTFNAWGFARILMQYYRGILSAFVFAKRSCMCTYMVAYTLYQHLHGQPTTNARPCMEPCAACIRLDESR